jgi:hypothetical protein
VAAVPAVAPTTSDTGPIEWSRVASVVTPDSVVPWLVAAYVTTFCTWLFAGLAGSAPPKNVR